MTVEAKLTTAGMTKEKYYDVIKEKKYAMNSKEMDKLKEKINERAAKLSIDYDLLSQEEVRCLKEDLLSLRRFLTGCVKSTVSGYYAPTVSGMQDYIYSLLEYERINNPLFLYEEKSHHYSVWKSKNDYETGRDKIVELAGKRELAEWLRERTERRIFI